MFKEDNGNVSSMRVMSFTCLIAAIVTGCYIVYKNPADASNGIYIFTAYLVGALCPKLLQKFAEEKIGVQIGGAKS
jgi:hypothetical protein